MENFGLGLAGVGWVTGVGVGGGLAVAFVGDVIQVTSHVGQFLAGNDRALGDAALSVIPGPKSAVSRDLRNDVGDAMSDKIYGDTMSATNP
jgi:hypothetical protein